VEDQIMTVSDSGTPRPPRRRRRLLSPSEKYDIWLQLIRGEITMGQAAEAHQVDRSVIAKLRLVARQGALSALAASKPGVSDRRRDYELEAANAEVARLGEAVKEMAVKLTLAEGKDRWG
jgi:transposase